MDTLPPRCSITFEIPADVREAGYRAACPNCGRLFIDARDWIGAICHPRNA